jgi:fermentation-respiration switch protein FrsA (DUF1100 family)
MRRFSVGVVLTAVAIAVGVASCDGLFYFPSRSNFLDPVSIGFPYQDVVFSSLDGTRLHGWFFAASGAPDRAKATVIHFHGNAENISTHFQAAAWLANEGFNVFAFDYRGYGQSDGTANREGIQEDAVAAIRWVRERPDVDADRLILFGQSLGAAIAVHVAAGQERLGLRAVVLESGFSSYREIARDKLAGSVFTWAFQWPLSFLVSEPDAPRDDIAKIAPVPVLIIHGTADPIVPYHHAQTLYAAAGEPKTFWTIPDGGHTSAFGRLGEIYRPRLVAFLGQSLADTSSSRSRYGELP